MGRGAACNPRRPGRQFRQRDPDLPDVARGVQGTAAPGRRLMLAVVDLRGCALAVPDHSTVSRRAAKLTSITRDSLPSGPRHVLIDNMFDFLPPLIETLLSTARPTMGCRRVAGCR